jgi:potassium efflux system protein
MHTSSPSLRITAGIRLRGVFRFALLALFGLIVLSAPPALLGQDAPPIEAPTEVEGAQLAERIAGLEAQEAEAALSAEDAQELALLREATQWIERGQAALAEAERFVGETRTAAEQLAQIEAFLATPIEQQTTVVDRALTVDELSAQLEATRLRLQAERDLRAKVETDAEFRERRRTEMGSQRVVSTERLDELSASLATAPDPSVTETIARARRWVALTEQYYHRAVIRSLDEELRSYDTRKPLLERRRAYRDRRIDVETRNAEALQRVIGEKQLAAARAAEQQAARQVEEAAGSHPAVQAVLAANIALASETTELIDTAKKAAAERIGTEGDLTKWRTAYDRSRARVQRAGLSNVIGQHLRSQRVRLPDANDLRQKMAVRERELSRLVNRAEDQLLLVERLADGEIDREVDERLQRWAADLPDDKRQVEEIRAELRAALIQQRETAAGLYAAINEYLDGTLLDLQNAQRDLYELVESYTDFIDERVLWIRSADVIDLADLLQTRDTLLRIVDSDEWLLVTRRISADMLRNVGLYVFAVGLIGALVALRRAMRRRLVQLAEQTKRYTTDRFSLTLLALPYTFMLAATLPAALWFISWRCGLAASGTALGVGLSDGFGRVAELLLLLELVRMICRPKGLGEAHFKWRAETLRAIRRQLRWFTPMVVPLSFIVGLTSGTDVHQDSLGRLAFVAAMLASSVFLQRLFRPSGPLLRETLAKRRGGWIDRLKYIWYPILVLGPIVMAVQSSLGYMYSVLQVEARAIDTAWLVVSILVGRNALLRGLFVTQRRLDIEQRRKRRLAQIEAARQAGGEAAAGVTTEAFDSDMPIIAEEEEVDVAVLSAQTRQLLNTAVLVTTVVGLVIVWSSILPALNYMQTVKLWTPGTIEAVASMEPVAAISPGMDNLASVPDTTEYGAITLGHLVRALIILAITVLVSRNIPGLLEIVLLQRLPISPSGRYAITTIARYLMIVIGLAAGFGAIGIGWSQVQWLAAAVTVGLGFGLQEIFANMVSGLIILFERPIRVGDTVTVGGVTGRVSRLRMRATTIVDWDRKELIIPNKEFVTGQIINWTLSDSILRLVIPVGIAYGSDTKRAEELLREVAKADPSVLDDPAPNVVFEEFADSSLNFTLRVFIPSIDDLLVVKHRLHNAIDQAFRKADIVIAFPQRDVYIHNVPQSPAQESPGDTPTS